jgi:hypothetical protein
MTDYRALCAELVELSAPTDSIPQLAERLTKLSKLASRARAALAQPEPVAPKPVVDYSRVPKNATEAQIRAAAHYLVKKRNCDGDLIPAIEYAIARWGTPAIQPVPVRERLPGPEDCDAEGMCWGWWTDPTSEYWEYVGVSAPIEPYGSYIPRSGHTHWLPANAIPTPEALPND